MKRRKIDITKLTKEDFERFVWFLENPCSREESDEFLRYCSDRFGRAKSGKDRGAGFIGELIVEIYLQVMEIQFELNPGPFYYKEHGMMKRLQPDGELTDTNELYEVKTRAYESSGTAHEKILGITDKYHRGAPNRKIHVFLLADDEHRYNIDWRKRIVGEIEPKDKYLKLQTQAARMVISGITTGTEIAKSFRNHIKGMK